MVWKILCPRMDGKLDTFYYESEKSAFEVMRGFDNEFYPEFRSFLSMYKTGLVDGDVGWVRVPNFAWREI